MDDSDSDLSSLSSVLSDVEADAVMDAKIEADIAAANKPKGIAKFFKPTPKNSKPVREVTPEPPKRAPSPPHEFVLADNDAIAFIVMFRSRFSDCFFSSLPHYGPQDIERGVVGEQPDENIERLLCALLNLVLNRTKPVERLHYGRALEEAISEHKNEWPIEWNGENPLRGSRTFQTMTAEERVSARDLGRSRYADTLIARTAESPHIMVSPSLRIGQNSDQGRLQADPTRR